MKIDEPKTPYEYATEGIEEEEAEAIGATDGAAATGGRKPEELDAQLLSER